MRFIGIIFIFISMMSYSQSNRVPSYFGIQYQSVIPNDLIGQTSLSMTNESFSSSIQQRLGYSMGSTVRFGITDLIAFETGINFTKEILILRWSFLIQIWWYPIKRPSLNIISL